MAKLDIEEIFFLEIMSVAVKMGDEDRALGNALRWFRFSQEKHKKGKLVSEREFRDNNFSDALFPKFAERVEGGICCAGAGKHFNWLLTKSEAGAMGGRASAAAREAATGSSVPAGASNEPEPKQTEASPSNPKQTEAAEPSPSYSPPPSDKKSRGGDARARSAAPPAPPVASPLWEDLQLAGYPKVAEVLEHVDADLQEAWKVYDPGWLRDSILRARVHHLEKEGVTDVRQVAGWRRRLDSWFLNEKRPKFRPRPAPPRAPAPTPEQLLGPIAQPSADDVERSLKVLGRGA